MTTDTIAPPTSPTWPFVYRFALRMEAQLEKNRHKGNREGWIKDDPGRLCSRLREESNELLAEMISGGDPDDVWNEAADAANMAMMTADAYFQAYENSR